MNKKDITQVRLAMLEVEVDLLQRLQHTMMAGLGAQRDELRARLHALEAADDLDAMEIADEVAELDQVEALATQLQVVALYSQVELITKKGLMTLDPKLDPKSLYKIKEVIKVLKKKGVVATKLKGYAAMDETRELNNCVKHSGTVSDDLARYPGWIKGAKIEISAQKMDALITGCADYVKELLGGLAHTHTKQSMTAGAQPKPKPMVIAS